MAKKHTASAAAADPAPVTAVYRVRSGVGCLRLDGVDILEGGELEMDADRAAGLGDVLEPVA